jgi:GTP-binding protein
MLLDATEEISRQDARVAAEGHRARKGMAIIGNKWDLVEKDAGAADRFVEKARRALPFLAYAPVLTVSALTGLRVERIFPLIVSIEEARDLTVPTAKLNRIIERIKEQNPPSYYSGGTGNIYYATQTGTKPPVFTLFVNQAAYFPRSYIRYINNQLRNMFTFEGTAIRISLKSKER